MEDRLGAVAVVDVPVQDRNPLQTELGLRIARGDDDVVDEAEPHGALGERVMAGWTDEREATAVDGLERHPDRERHRLPGRSRGDRVGIQVRDVVERLDALEVLGLVRAQKLLLGARALHRVSSQHGDPLLPLGVGAGGVELGEARIGQRLDGAASSSRRASCASPSACAARAPALQSGCRSSIGGSGADRSKVAMCR